MFQHLLRPFAYLTIEHRFKWQVDWLIPAVLALATTALVYVASTTTVIAVFGDTGIIARVLGFVQNLPGFYIAALAAIATFNKPDIDRHMPEPAPLLDIQVQGKNVAVKLTRRRFLCSMFAFLTAESIVITLLAIVSLSIADSVKAAVPEAYLLTVKFASLMIFLTIFWQMIVASFWGLYYLGERLQQPDQVPPP